MLNMSAIASRLTRSVRLMRRAIRRSLNTVYGFNPALRPRLPSSAGEFSAMGADEAATVWKQGSWKNPLGENCEATVVLPQSEVGVPPGTMIGRPVSGENWKLSALPVMMLNGRPEEISMMGAMVQSLHNLRAKPLVPTLPL